MSNIKCAVSERVKIVRFFFKRPVVIVPSEIYKSILLSDIPNLVDGPFNFVNHAPLASEDTHSRLLFSLPLYWYSMYMSTTG